MRDKVHFLVSCLLLSAAAGCAQGPCEPPSTCPEGSALAEDGLSCVDGEGRRQGPAAFFHEDGSCGLATFRDGLVEGEWALYWPDGGLRSQVSYRRGAEHGPWRLYHPGGRPHVEGAYWHGRRDGEWRRYAPDGRLAGTARYERGRLLPAGAAP